MFEDLKMNLDLMDKARQKGEELSADELLEAAVMLLDAGMDSRVPRVDDLRSYASALVNLREKLLPVYKENCDAVVKLDPEMFSETVSDLNKAEAELAAKKDTIRTLTEQRDRLAELTRQNADADEIKAGLTKSVEIYEANKKAADEAGAVLKEIGTAWDKLRQDDAMSKALTPEECAKFPGELSSFSDIADWFDGLGSVIRSALAQYESAYNMLLTLREKQAGEESI